MKKLHFLLLLITQSIFAQNSWLPLGPEDDNKLINSIAYLPITQNKNGEIFSASVVLSSGSLPVGIVTLRQFKLNKWIPITNSTFEIPVPLYENLETSIEILIDNENNFYLTSENWIYQFINGEWTNILSSGQISAKLDQNGVLHACYIGDVGGIKKIIVQIYLNNSWFDIGKQGISLQKAFKPSIAFDSKNTPYIVYIDEVADNKLTVQKFNGTNWELVGNIGFSSKAGYYPTIAIDKNDVIYVSYFYLNPLFDLSPYYDGGGKGFSQMLTKYNNNQWVELPNPNHNFTDSENDTTTKTISFKKGFIYFDEINNAVFLGSTLYDGGRYTSDFSPALSFLSKFNENEWANLFSKLNNRFGSILVQNGNIYCPFSQGIKKFTSDKNWVNLVEGDLSISDLTTDDNGFEEYKNINIEKDNNNIPYIGLTDRNNVFTIKKFNGINWEKIVETKIDNSFPLTTFKIKKSNEIILLSNDLKNEINLYSYTNGSLNQITNSGFAYPSGFIKMVLNEQEIPYIVYADPNNNYRTTVKKVENGNWVNIGESAVSFWKSEYPSIAIDKNNNVYVAYIDLTYDKKLTVKKFDGTKWISLDKEGFTQGVVSSPWLAVNQQNEVLVCYGDESALGKISVQKWINEKWEYIGQQGFSESYGGYSKMLIDNNDTPYVLCKGNEMPPTIYKFDNDAWNKLGNKNFNTSPDIYDFTIVQNGVSTPIFTYCAPSNLAYAYYYGNEDSQLSNEYFQNITDKSTIVYPNPVKDILQISSNYSQAQIFDYTGRMIKNTDITNHAIDLTELSAGNYILKLSSGKNQETIKIIKE